MESKPLVSNETRECLGAFAPEKWDDLPQVEKEQALETLRDHIANDLGIQNKPQIEYYNNPDKSDFGGYAASTNTIYINRFNMDDAKETADTVAHETRHCWQHERADDPKTEQDLRFKDNFDDYIQPEDDFAAYQAQPVESDARAYAENITDQIPNSRHEAPDVATEPKAESRPREGDATRGPPGETEASTARPEVSKLPEDFDRKVTLVPVSPEVKKSLEGSGLTDEKIKEIRELPKPDYENSHADEIGSSKPDYDNTKVGEHVSCKPDPKTYLNPEYIDKHLKPFEETGCFRIQKTDPTAPGDRFNGNLGHESGMFVTSGEQMKKALQESGGDVRKMEEALGLPEYDLGNSPTIICINEPKNLRMPSGNELGALPDKFIPGGYSSGNVAEAVIDPVPKGDYKVIQFHNPNALDWVDKRGNN